MARPTKKALTEVKNKNKGVIGRPKGDTAIINEYKTRMLNSPKSAKVLESIFDAALNDDHKNQAAAWKIITDRIMPVSVFEQSKAGGSTPQITINVSNLGTPSIISEEKNDSGIIDIDVTDIDTQ